jgi:hypothetical protein
MMRWCEDNKIKQSARDLSWCWPVEEVLANKNFYLRLVMQYGEKRFLDLANKHFTMQDFIEAIETAPSGFFFAEVWHEWRKRLGLPKKRTSVRFAECENDPEDWWRNYKPE